jgi:hypothetical protein
MQEFQHLQVVSLEISKLELSLFFVSFLVLSKLVVGSKSQLATVDVFWGEATDSNIRPSPGPLSNTAGGSQATNNDGIL